MSSFAAADGTRLWQQSKYDELEKGTAKGVAIHSDGSLSLAPAFTALYTSPSAYLWALVSDAQGDAYAAAGSPARVYRITPEGKASVIFAPQELSVQALAIDGSGAIYAATSPDGKVYKITHNGQSAAKPAETSPSATVVDPSYTASVFFEPKSKYIWALAFDKQGRLYVGTGDRGEIFRVEPSGAGAVFFKSDEVHMRVLAFDHSGNLLVGTDGSGLIYRITPQGEGYVLYDAPKKEITALAVDAQGNIYAAGAGDRRGASPQPPTGQSTGAMPGAPTTMIVIQAPSQATGGAPAIAPAPFPAALNLGGSEVYRLAPEGSPKTVWTSKDDIVYALAFDAAGHLIAGTGNKGRLYAISDNQYTDLTDASANQVTAFARAPQGGLYATTSNLGKIFLIGANPAAEGTYESDVFDAKIFSKWGRPEVRGEGNFEFFARSGNLDNPDRNWSPWKKVDLANAGPVESPAARFLQWKVVLHAGTPEPEVQRVAINYLPKNVAPEVDEVAVTVGARVPASAHTSNTSSEGSFDSPIPTIPDKHNIAVRWKAHDENDDQLVYSVYYRGDGEKQWKKLNEDLTERYANLEADMFPDGGYTVRVVASDLPSHSPSEALTGEKTSDRFEVDNTPPQVEIGSARIEGGKLHLSFRATDSFSPISHAEISIDADDWQTAEPVGQISDYKVENYDLTAPIPAVDPKDPPLTEHIVVVRVFDRYDNVGVAKIVIKSPPSSPSH